MLVWHPITKEIILTSGWKTATSKTAMNTALKQINEITNNNFRVFQYNFKWYVKGVTDTNGVSPVTKTIDFKSGMVIKYE
jgi:hypothetical protein